MNELSLRLWRAANAKQTGKEKNVVDMFNLSDLDEKEEIDYVGQGQFSMIFRTTLVGSSNPVAVKVFYDSERHLSRHEAKIYHLIGKHDNITEFIGLCDRPDFSALLLEYVDGGSFDHFFRPSVINAYGGEQWWDQCLNVAMQITCGMVHLHNLSPEPVTSIELSPESVLIRRKGRRVFCKLTGFCYAHVGGGNDYVLNSSMFPLGSPSYIAPERCLVFSGNTELRKKHDVWSFGIILWEIRERTRLFRGHFNTIHDLIINAETISLLSATKDSPEGFNNIQMNCCAMNPVQRPSFLDLKERLNSLLSARAAEQLGLDDDDAKQIYLNALDEGYAETTFIRINIVGKDGAGKTSLWKSLTEQMFDPKECSTVGATSENRNLHIVVKETCNWTTAIDTEESLKAFDRILASSIATRMKQERERCKNESSKQPLRSSPPTTSVNKVLEESQTASLSTPMSTAPTQRTLPTVTPMFSELPATEATKQYLDTLPDDVKRLVWEFMNDEEAHSEAINEKYIDAMDFGGQYVFYATHYLYLNKDAIYYVVFDASEKLSESSKSYFRSDDGITEIKLFGQMTNYDRFEEWLSAVYVLDLPNRAEVKTGGVCPIVFPIGTHKDIAENKTVQDEVTAAERTLLEWQKEYMFQQIESKEDLLQHLADPDRVFYVDNTHAARNGQRKDDIQDIRCLTEQIAEEMKQELEIRVPFRWLRFEKKVRLRKIELARKGDCEPIVSLSSLRNEAKDCGINAEEEFLVALN
ncbi:probable serine/threonine-protein kinase roco5 isoform X2 [Oscarella lobularis]|uniref:probable serine/threonine-protein kinase roco5 isoform X2 n=1 Tax=Oscarella lobularis TaxID=121494 RepID=UPI0033144707